MKALTRHQAKLLEFLRAHMMEHGIPPSYDEIGAALELSSKCTVARILGQLQVKGYIIRIARRARAIELLHTEDHHRRDCACAACDELRYMRQLKLVQALKVEAPIRARTIAYDNLVQLSVGTRAELLGLSRRTPSRGRAAIPAGTR